MANPSSPISPYDTPALLASMLVDGEFTARGGMNAIMNPAALSPSERETVQARLKAKAGNSSVAGAMIDIALNPWTWVFFVTSPVGSTALAEGGRGLFGVSKKYLETVMDKPGFLKQIGALTGWQILRGKVTPDALIQVAEEQAKKIYDGAAYEAPLAKWMQERNLPTLDVTKLTDPAKIELAERANKLLQASLTGRDTDQVRTVIKGFKITEDKNLVLDLEDKMSFAWTNREGAIEQHLQDMGLVEARDSIRQFYNQRWNDLFGTTESTLRVYRGIRNPVVGRLGENGSTEEGTRLISQLVGDDVVQLVSQGKVSQDEFHRLIDSLRKNTKEGAYLPRNTFTVVGRNLDPLDRQARLNAYALGATKSAVPREKFELSYLPEDLESLKKILGSDASKYLDEDLRQATGKVAAAKERMGEGAYGGLRFLRMDPVEATRRYNNETAVTYAWHVADPSATVRARMKDEYENLRSGGVHYSSQTVSDQYWHGAAKLDRHIDSVPVKEQPLGGFSLADVVHSGWAVERDPYAREAITSVLIPAVSGKHRIEHTAMKAALNNGRRMMDMFTNTALGRAIEGTGGRGKRFIEAMREYSKPENAGKIYHDMANVLYVTHLGFSIPSMLLNMTQPMGLAATWVGVNNTLHGYAMAAKETLDYVGKRLERHGTGPISDAQRAALARETFSDATQLGIGPNMLEQLDSRVFSSGEPYRKSGPFDVFTHYAMGGFGLSEWFNRAATGHAFRRAWTQAGRELHDPLFKSELQQFVNETQYAAHPLNQPINTMTDNPKLVRTGALFTNPLVRQFLTYPWRTFLGYTKVASGLGGRDGNLWGFANDFGRSMAISTVMVEAAKNLLHTDASKIGAFSQLTDIIPGFSQGRYDSRETPIPTPPIIDIPFNIVKGIAMEDRTILANSLARTIPGGIALARALNVAPEIPPPFSWVQKTHADWGSRTPDGQVPVYSHDGRLIQTAPASSLILKGLGVDTTPMGNPAQVDSVLLKNREEMQQYRSQYLGALLSSNTGKANSIREEFSKRFKIPLTVTKQQVAQAQRLRTVPRGQRILDTLPMEAKPLYQQIVQQQPPTNEDIPGAIPAFQSPQGYLSTMGSNP